MPDIENTDKPRLWRPMYYPKTIDVEPETGKRGQNDIILNSDPFLLKMVTHVIIVPTADPTSGLYQDAQYLIEFSDERTSWQSGPMHASAFGTVDSRFLPLPAPIPFIGGQTIHIEITNLVDRTAYGPWKVHIVFSGVQRLT